MKKLIISFLSICLFASCSSVSVVADYDSKTDFTIFKTFAFYKKGIDKAKISDLDKRRILKAIEAELLNKGLKKSENPDMLVSIFAKSRKKVSVNSRFDNRILYYPSYYYGRERLRVTKYTEGTLFVDFIDVKNKKLIWQGIGSGALGAKTGPGKAERIQTFVHDIIDKYPIKTEK